MKRFTKGTATDFDAYPLLAVINFVEFSIQWCPVLRPCYLPRLWDPGVKIQILLVHSTPYRDDPRNSSLPHDCHVRRCVPSLEERVRNMLEEGGMGADDGAREGGKGTALNHRGGRGAEVPWASQAAAEEGAAAQRMECPSCRDGEERRT